MARMNPHQQLVALRDLLNDQGFNFQEDKEYTKFMSMDSSFRNERKFVDDHHRMSMRLVGGGNWRGLPRVPHRSPCDFGRANRNVTRTATGAMVGV